eukprot:4367848-Lingulodinium_polyedra.AAC.1
MPKLPDVWEADVGLLAAGDNVQRNAHAVVGGVRELEAVLVVSLPAVSAEQVKDGDPSVSWSRARDDRLEGGGLLRDDGG